MQKKTSKNDAPLASIVIPSYNYGEYLGAAIKSALGQGYKNIEIIVVDGGSDDNSVEIARKYPVKVLELGRCGLAKAIGAGVAASKGSYILKLDSDDMLHPDFASKTVAALEENPELGYAYTQLVGFGADSFFFESCAFSLKMLLKRPAYIPGSVLIRKIAYLEAGGYDLSLPFQEDWDFLLKLAERGRYGVLVPLPLLFYRQHFQSRGRRRAWDYTRMLWKLRRRHSALFARHLGALDWLGVIASDIALFAYMLARDAFTALRIWAPIRKGMVNVVAALQPGYAYANEVPKDCEQLIKKMDAPK